MCLFLSLPLPPEQSLGGFPCPIPQCLKARGTVRAHPCLNLGCQTISQTSPHLLSSRVGQLPPPLLLCLLVSYSSQCQQSKSVAHFSGPHTPTSLLTGAFAISSSLYTVHAPLASLPGPCTFPGWPILPLLEATYAVCLACSSLGTRKT